MDARYVIPSWWGGDDVIICVSGVHTNPNTKTHRAVFILSTLGPGVQKVCFWARRLDSQAKRTRRMGLQLGE